MFALNQGEVCTCRSRVLARESIYERFIEKAVARVERIKFGHLLDMQTMIGGLSVRGSERDLIPWSLAHGVPLMAYSLGSGGGLLRNPVLAEVARKHGVGPAAIAIAWTLRNGITVSIPEARSADHIRENAAAMTLSLDAEDLAKLDKAFPALRISANVTADFGIVTDSAGLGVARCRL